MILERAIPLFAYQVRYSVPEAEMREELNMEFCQLGTYVARLACAHTQRENGGQIEWELCAHKVHDYEPPVFESRCDHVYDRFYRRTVCRPEVSDEVDRCVLEEYKNERPWCLVSVRAMSADALELTVENSTRRITFKTAIDL